MKVVGLGRSSRDITSWRVRARAVAESPHAAAAHTTTVAGASSSSAQIPGEQLTAAEAKRTMMQWADWAAKQLSAEIVERAQQLAQQQMAQGARIVQTGNVALAIVMGVLAPEDADLSMPAQLEELKWRHLLVELGQALQMFQDHTSSAHVFGAAAHRFSLDPSGRRAAAAAAMPEMAQHSTARHLEREIFTHWAVAVERLGLPPKAVHELAVRRGLWRSPLQRPLDHCACAPAPP